MNTSKPDVIISTALIVNTENQYLFLKRSATSRRFPNLWQFPEGKPEGHETAEQAVKREIIEELSVHLTQVTLKEIVTFVSSDANVIRTIFSVIWEPQEITIDNEHSEYLWLPSAEALNQLELIAGTREVLTQLT